jgi:hypothetical protein
VPELWPERATLIDAPVIGRLGFDEHHHTIKEMTMAPAQWMIQAKDLTDDPGRAALYLTVGQLSNAVGLAPGTITDSLTRPPITVKDNPRRAICRPAARIGRLPLWTRQQLDEFLAIRDRVEKDRELGPHAIEAVTVDQALERGLFSLVEYAELFDVHDQTLRRAQSQDGTFPPAVARRRKDVPGVPEHLFERAAMTTWAESKGYIVQEGVQA